MTLLMPLLIGCLNGDGQILESWEGTYKTQRLSLAEASCEEGPDIELEPPFFEIDTAVGKGAHLVAIRRCQSAGDCEGISWFEAIVVGPKAKSMEGDVGDFNHGGPEDSCSVQWVGLTFTRGNSEAKNVEIEIEIHVDDGSFLSEEQCINLLEDAPLDEDCDSFYVLEGKRLP